MHARLAATVALLCVASGALAQAPDGIYKGKQVKVVISSGAGGGYDAYARVLAHHLDRYLPGAPAVVTQNMPGAAGMLATNWTYNVAPKDGTVLLATYNALIPEPLFGNPSVQFDPQKFEWVGSIGKQQNVCVVWHTSAIQSIEAAKQRQVTVASTGATGYSATMPVILNALLGTRFKVVIGYATTEARLAVERGEAEGICGLSWSTLMASNPDWILNKRIRALLQTGSKPRADLPDVPLLVDAVKTPEDRKVVELISFAEELGRPFVMPPGTPKPMVLAMRRAFDAVMKDPAFLDEAKKVMLEVDPVTGEEMEEIIRRNYAAPKDLVKRAAELLATPAK
jgi:tripartite-type tricarboxylate transporter receptor subunit TctC